MKVSVFVVTYNQENYIRQALDSILMQQVNFDFEVVIGDDASTDATGYICDEYASRFSCIHVWHHRINIGIRDNWQFVLNHCRGKYIAMLEGDDYWTDSLKLQKQVDFLDSHPNCNLCFTNVVLVDEQGLPIEEKILLPNKADYYSPKDIYSKWICLTGSVMMRNIITPVHYSDSIYITDTYTFLLVMQNTMAYCMSDVTTAYRRHGKNVSKDTSVRHACSMATQYRYMAKCFPQKELKNISRRKENDYLEQIIYVPYFKGQWKYRFRYMWLHPQLLFSAFMTTTILSYTPIRKLKKKK